MRRRIFANDDLLRLSERRRKVWGAFDSISSHREQKFEWGEADGIFEQKWNRSPRGEASRTDADWAECQEETIATENGQSCWIRNRVNWGRKPIDGTILDSSHASNASEETQKHFGIDLTKPECLDGSGTRADSCVSVERFDTENIYGPDRDGCSDQDNNSRCLLGNEESEYTHLGLGILNDGLGVIVWFVARIHRNRYP